MAEAAVENISISRYYCHKCNREIAPLLPDFKCPFCSLGFIEELSSQGNSNNNTLSQTQNNEETNSRHSEAQGQTANTQRSRRHSVLIHNWPGQFLNSDGPLETTIFDRLQPLLQQFTQHLTSGQGTQRVDIFPVTVRRILGNYVLEGTLDNITMQLVNQVDMAGPLPMAPQKIEALPRYLITHEQVSKGLVCPICIEEFHVEEEVRQLQCEHQFHGHCIVPWLEMHATCPVCRLTLEGDDDAETADESSDPSADFSQQDRNMLDPNANQLVDYNCD